MSTLRSEDRVSLCLFTFADGRRCRTPRISAHPHFCFVHARKEARARATEKLSADLAYFFSGDYVSACDLSTAISRIIPAVIRGDIKPKTASTVAYLAQTLIQAIHLTQREYVNAFGAEGWRKSVRQSVEMNSDYQTPVAPTSPKETHSPVAAEAPGQTQAQTQPVSTQPIPSDPTPPLPYNPRPTESAGESESFQSPQAEPNLAPRLTAPAADSTNGSLQEVHPYDAPTPGPVNTQPSPVPDAPYVPQPCGFITTGRFRNRNRQHLQPL